MSGMSHAVARHDQLQMRADVPVERFEAVGQVQVIVQRQRRGMRIQAEGAQGARQARHFDKQLFGMRRVLKCTDAAVGRGSN